MNVIGILSRCSLSGRASVRQRWHDAPTSSVASEHIRDARHQVETPAPLSKSVSALTLEDSKFAETKLFDLQRAPCFVRRNKQSVPRIASSSGDQPAQSRQRSPGISTPRSRLQRLRLCGDPYGSLALDDIEPTARGAARAAAVTKSRITSSP